MISFYKSVDDMRGTYESLTEVNPTDWRIKLREQIYMDRKCRSDLTQMPLRYGFECHEGMFQRRWVGKQNWQELLFAGVNCFILLPNEHSPNPPDRTTCYWLAVARYGMESVERWIDSLPWKVPPDRPWRGSCGAEVISRIQDRWQVSREWYVWFNKVYPKINMEA